MYFLFEFDYVSDLVFTFLPGSKWLILPIVRQNCSIVPWRCRAVFPRHALHEKGSQRQKGVGPLVSSQERRALLAPLINRLSSACQPFIVPPSVYIGFPLFVFLGRRSGDVFDALAGKRDACLLGELFCQHPVLPGPALPPHRAPRPDPPVVCPGFGIVRLVICQASLSKNNSTKLFTESRIFKMFKQNANLLPTQIARHLLH